MFPGPMRNGCPQAPLKVGMSVVKATTVVGSPSKPVKCSAGVCRTSRASARPATAADTASRMVEGSPMRSEEHTSELQSRSDLVCRLLLEKKKKKKEPNRLSYDIRHSPRIE